MEATNMLLSGIVGSTAYGLAGPGSDIDRLGVFAVPTVDLHGLRRPKESLVSTAPDRTLHEAAKYVSLCLSGNPTAMELLWLPDDLYEVRTPLGDELVEIRSGFLSAARVREAYLGYAARQFRKLEARGDALSGADTRRRTAKHARHLARLLLQGRELYATGQLRVRLDDPQWFLDFGDRVADGRLDEARVLVARAESDFETMRSVLPERPDEHRAELWLRAVRAAFLKPVEPSRDLPPGGARRTARAAAGTSLAEAADMGLAEMAGTGLAESADRRPAQAANGVFLVDIDGTVALRDESAPDCRTPYEWHRVGEDLPNRPVITVVRALAAAGHRIVYVSGRSERCRAATGVWLAEHVGVPGEALLMRRRRDNRRDDIVKKELYRRLVKPRWEVIAVLDDRDQVVRMWRDLGLTVLQVAYGDF